jgi:redox-sensitive bicupin YhaK (pirin superfamily)
VIVVRQANQRGHTTQPGIESWHSFSAGPHYDRANVSFGALVGVDEHLVEPGAGFDWHTHNGVRIVSYVLAGTLRHEDMASVTDVGTGEVLTQEATSATRHAERNASRTEPLRFVQMTVLARQAATFDLITSPRRIEAPRAYVFAVGAVLVGESVLRPGDEARLVDETALVEGAGPGLLWTMPH